jgi:hypothetical protein
MRIFLKLYSFPSSTKSRILISFGFFISILLILLIFKPFGFNSIRSFVERFIVAFGYGFIAFITWFVALNSTKLIIKRKINLIYIIAFIIIVQFMCGMLSMIYNNLIFRNPSLFEFFLRFQEIVFLTGIIPDFMLFLFLDTIFYQNIISPDESKIEDASRKEDIILRIEDENPDKSVSVPINEIIYIHSMDNYIKIGLQKNGIIQKPLVLRSTLKKIEDNIGTFECFYRCHRSYIVNLSWVKEIVGNSISKKFVLKCNGFEVPISRAKINSSISLLKKMQFVPKACK